MLSTELVALDLPQQSDKFVKLLRQAIRDGVVSASHAAESIPLPKVYRFKVSTGTDTRERKRTTAEGDGYTKKTNQMVILQNEAYQTWFEKTKEELGEIKRTSGGKRSGGTLLSVAALMSDPALFSQGVESTKNRLRKHQEQAAKLASSEGFGHARKRPAKAPEEPVQKPVTAPAVGSRKGAGAASPHPAKQRATKAKGGNA